MSNDSPFKIQRKEVLSALRMEGKITNENFKQAIMAVSSTNQPLDAILVELGILDESMVARLLSQFFGVEVVTNFLDLNEEFQLEKNIIQFCHENDVVLQTINSSNGIVVCVADPTDTSLLSTLEFSLSLPCEIAVACRSHIVGYNQQSIKMNTEIELPVEFETDGDEVDIQQLKDTASDVPIVRFVSRLIADSVAKKASDIHIEPYAIDGRVRLRINGVLEFLENIPASMFSGIVSRIKILSGLNIAENRIPQDGRMRTTVRGKKIDLRVSIIPTVSGERIVLRILNKSADDLELSKLGVDSKTVSKINDQLACENGLFLLTGPTGSGKTTTLYSILNNLDLVGKNVITIEDPVEIRMPEIAQIQVDTNTGLDFEIALRAILRHDPNVILIGEIRHQATAKIAIRLALTGHLVLATLHTNSAVGAITRLRDLGIEDFLLSATVRGVMAQRLVRKIAPKDPSFFSNQTADKTQEPEGRAITYELFSVTSELSKAISSGMNEAHLFEAAVRSGMVPMSKHAEHLIASGIVSKEEIYSILDVSEGRADG